MRVDVLSLASGAVMAALGALLLLDSSGAIDLSLGWLAVVLTAAVGSILVVAGLADGGATRHDSDRGDERAD
jgi:hypothetical protein